MGDEIISFDEENVFAADSNFLELFTFPLTAGDVRTALHKPNSILMTQETASRYFPDEDPIGKQVLLGRGGSSRQYEVTGVFQDIPENSYIDFDILLSMSSFPAVERRSWSWIWTTFETFVLLREAADPGSVRRKLNSIPRKHAEATLQRAMGITFEDYIKGGKEWKLYLQPFTDIHLGSAMVINRLNVPGNQKVVNALATAGLFVLLLSCINYMNLKTSQSTRYIKNTGIRKLMGSAKWQIATQYLVESLLFVFVSIVIGILLAYHILPFFGQVSGKEIDPTALWDLGLLGYLLLLAVLMSLIGGIYPAVLLSAFTPLDVVQNKVTKGRESKVLRNLFVVLQFSISIALIASTAIVYQQLRHWLNKDVGFRKANLVSINRVEWLDNNRSFVEELRGLPGVVNASLNNSMPPTLFNGDQFRSQENQNQSIPLNYTVADEKYLPTLGVELLYGRNFSEIAEQEKYSVIINESAVRVLGWEVNEDVLGKKIIYYDAKEPFRIIGIARDFNYWSLHADIEPMAIFHADNPVMGLRGDLFVAVSLQGNDLPLTLDRIRDKWEALNSGVTFDYRFVDEAFASSFQATERFGYALGIFAGLALFIAGMGLLGMVIFVVEQRTKEIGIRKVFGASVLQVITLMSRRFMILILAALVLSIPVTVWAMDKWLLDFQYRITISPWVFVISGVAATFLALGIVGFQSMKAAMMNPVKVLRDE